MKRMVIIGGCIVASIVLIALVIVLGGAIRGCSNDIDRIGGSSGKSFEWWAW